MSLAVVPNGLPVISAPVYWTVAVLPLEGSSTFAMFCNSTRPLMAYPQNGDEVSKIVWVPSCLFSLMCSLFFPPSLTATEESI